jgi:DNA-binding MarR family transcriptional regulator
VQYNERKFEVLDYIFTNETTSSDDISFDLGIEIHNSRMLLRKYWKQGLLRRKKVNKLGKRVYSLSEKGEERLKFLGDAL